MIDVRITPKAQKEFSKITKTDRIKITKKIHLLEQNSNSGKKLEGKLSGLYSLRVWPCRIIYLIDSKKVIWIVHIFHRKEVYKKA